MLEVRRDSRCPHLLKKKVFGEPFVAALFEYACARECNFASSLVKNRISGSHRLDTTVRNSARLADLGKFKSPIRLVLERIADPAIEALGLSERAAELSELEINRYADRGRFVPHIDTGTTLTQLRVLSCVYYFAPSPLRFTGGALRLHSLPSLPKRDEQTLHTVDIMPETDTLVIFPSWLFHEVLPVETPSNAWADGRFAVNCWFHRVSYR
jgi:SM-20-related protein